MRVIGAALAAVMLTSLAPPIAAGTLSSQSDAVKEGHDLKITFSTSAPQNAHVRYKYKTGDGTAVGSGGNEDYKPTSGYVQWAPNATNAIGTVTVKTLPDQICEYDETVKVILTSPQWSINYARLGWGGFCPNNRSWPCRFEAVATITNDPYDCNSGQFGE
ncbi:MAG: hypothetical protein OXH99_12640 [Bryobacterales bacterium]|nr:hypothetical protein [Defluviicoccus sp.]MDE0627239.1 hypothetical protein [Bryobacterales bacterium]